MIVLQPQTLVEDWVHVYSGDPALNQEHPEFSEIYERWHETGRDEDIAAITREGQKPTYWRMRHPKGRLRETLSDAMKLRDNGVPSNATLFDACRMCLVGTDSLAGDEHLRFALDPSTKVKMLDDESMAALQGVDGGKLVYELGVAAILKIFPMPKKK